MRVRVAATALGITAALLSLSACTHHTTPHAAPSKAGNQGGTVHEARALPSAVLDRRLLDQSDLGGGYLRTPQRPARHDDVTVVGCPALARLGADTATGGGLDFPRKAQTAFTYNDASSPEISEELYSADAADLSAGIGRIVDAMTGCPAYRIIAGTTPLDITAQQLTPPRVGDEQWSLLLTFSAAGRSTVVKETAIRDGSLLVVLSGSPTLVDRSLGTALAKATTAN
ncbi:hypothetical protein [Streptomyces acidiscabies]|uniref:hypothetical protein n=1 Tax=Streptomyces acidiscabies TaxID=42234 RepID=UPI0009535BC9|nr:hypothetical protein [Streptomyces acidiscabies]